jgi:hypothetical protein
MIRAFLCSTSNALWRLCRRERISISPRVPRNVSLSAAFFAATVCHTILAHYRNLPLSQEFCSQWHPVGKTTCAYMKPPDHMDAIRGSHIRWSRCFDLDFLRGLLRLGLFGQFHSKYALLEARFDLVGVNTLRQLEVALE